jgi:hypothetical protein
VRVCKVLMKVVTAAVFTIGALSIFFVSCAAPCRAQATGPSDGAYLHGTNDVNSTPAATSAITGQPPAADPAASALPQAETTPEDDKWHFSTNPYLWFPGVHGTLAGPNGGRLDFRASPGDLLSNSRFGIMTGLQVRRKRLVASLDVLWIRLEDDKALPFPALGAISANMKATEFLLTPKIGFRVIDEKKIKVDALAGFRYWYLGENLKFNPSLLGLNFSGSQNFVDPVLGGRIQVALSPKISVNVLGDVGGWGTGSQLEYQVAGLLGYKIKPRLTLQVGYRYLNVNYLGARGIVFDATTAGVLFGATLNLK